MKIIYHFTLFIIVASLFSGCSIFPKQVTLKKTKQQEFSIEKKEYELKVTATAYTSTKRQTDSTPYLAAWNNRLKPGIKSIAISRDLLAMGLGNGSIVTIDGLRGKYKVLDKMNKRWKKKIDIYMGLNHKKAIHWGKRKVTIRWKRKSIVPVKSTKQKPYIYAKAKKKK